MYVLLHCIDAVSMCFGKTQKKPAEAGSEFLLRGMSYPKLSLGS